MKYAPVTLDSFPPPTKPKQLSSKVLKFTSIPQQYYATLPNTILAPSLSEKKFTILQKILRNTIPLGQACSIRCGLAKPGFTKHLLSTKEYHQLSPTQKEKVLPFLNAGDVRRYKLRLKKYLPYTPNLTSIDQWGDFRKPKLVISGMAKRLRAAFDQTGHALGRVYYITKNRAPYNPYFLLAVLNSRLINAYFSLLFVATHLRSGYIRYNATYLRQIPLATPTQQQEDDLAELAQLLVENPKYLKKGLDREIDDAVNKLYCLSAEEVSLFEE